MKIVLLGAPGAGKGTQATLLCQAKKLPHISTGDMMRAAIAKGSSLGEKVKKYLDAGQLVPDEIVIDVVKDRLSQDDCNNGFLLDGFPRTVAQAEALDRVLSELKRDLTHVIELQVPEKVLLERIESRASQGSGRSDDTPEVAKKRLEVYRAQTAPVTAYYAAKKTPSGAERLFGIDGIGTVEDVHLRVLKALNP